MKKSIKERAIAIFNSMKSNKISDEDLHKAEEKAKNLNDYMKDFMLLIDMCKDSINGKYPIDKWNLSIIIGTIIYVVSPIDAIPDFIPVVGWLDDATIVGYALSKLAQEISNYKAFKEKQTI